MLDMSPYVAWKVGQEPGVHRHVGLRGGVLSTSGTGLRGAPCDSGWVGIRRFRLSGAVVHSGSLGGGHYVAYVRRGSRWFYVSDSHVKVVSEAAALGCQAYLLFYVRV